MSKIIRGFQLNSTDVQKVEIKLRSSFMPLNEEEPLAEQQVHVPTLEEIMQERDLMLENAATQINVEREQFEQYRSEQLQALEELKVLWEQEKLVLEQQAYEKAFSEGYEEGIQKASSSMEKTLQLVNATMDNAKVNADKYIMDQEHVILDLALKSAEKIIGYELEQKDEAFVAIVKRALKDCRESQSIKVYVPVEHYEFVTNYRDELAEMFPPDVQFLIFANEDLNNLESYIETNHGRMIVSIDEQLQQLRLKLSEILDSKE